eukprot:5215951-Prymnesium_polylepis.1
MHPCHTRTCSRRSRSPARRRHRSRLLGSGTNSRTRQAGSVAPRAKRAARGAGTTVAAARAATAATAATAAAEATAEAAED